MKLSSKNQFIQRFCNIFGFTFYVIISSFICSALVFNTAQGVNNEKTDVDKLWKEFGHSLPISESHQNIWQTPNGRIPTLMLLNEKPLKNHEQNQRIRYWIKSHKRQEEENPPPGFVGARGRRKGPDVWEDYKTLTEVFPDLWSHMRYEPSEELMSTRLASGKKSDNIVYKEGFLGVRG